MLKLIQRLIRPQEDSKFKGSFVPNTTKEWNKLPSNLKEEVDFDKFKKEILQNRKCNPLFYAGERKINVIHAQMRMKYIVI